MSVSSKLKKFFIYCKNVEEPYTHFSSFSYYVSLVLTIFYCYACFYFVTKTNADNFIVYFLNISNLICLILLLLTRFTVTINNNKIRRKFYGVFRETCKINSYTLYIYIAYHIFLCFSINTLYYILYFFKISSEYKDQFLFLMRCISVYFYIVHRILRPADREDVLRTLLELELPEICMDYFDSSELLSIYVLSGKDTIKFVDFVICMIWNFSIFLRFIYLTLIHFPYSFKNLWTHLGFADEIELEFDFLQLISAEGNEDYRFNVALKLRIFLLIPMLIADILSLLFRIIVMIFLDIDQKDFIFALIFKNLACIYRTISAILNYNNCSKNSLDSNNSNAGDLSCFKKLKICLYQHLINNLYFYFITLMLIVFVILKAFIQYLFWILDFWWTFIILIIDLSIFSALFFNSLSDMISYNEHNMKLHALMPVYIYVLFSIPCIYYPILYFNLKELPMQIPLMNLSPQNAIWFIIIGNFVLFFSSATLKNLGESLINPRDKKLNRKEVVSMLFITSLSSESIMDYTSSAIFFMSYNQSFSITLKIFIVLILILEHYFSGIISIFIFHELDPKSDQKKILETKTFIKTVRIISDSLGFIIRMVLLFEYKYDSNVFIFKSLCRILHCLAVLERQILKYYKSRYSEISLKSISFVRNNDYPRFKKIYNIFKGGNKKFNEF